MPDGEVRALVETSFKGIYSKYKHIIIPIAVGILGYFIFIGIVQGILEYMKQNIWNFFSAYNETLFGIPQLQILFFSLVYSAMIGYIAAQSLGSSIRNYYEALNAGLLSGISAGVLLVLGAISFHLWPWASDNIWMAFIFMIMPEIFIISQGLGALLQFRWKEKKANLSHPVINSQKKRSISKLYLFSIILLALIIIVPYGTAFLGMRLGMIDRYHPRSQDAYAVSRLDKESIKITQLTENDVTSMHPFSEWFPNVKKPGLKILVNHSSFADPANLSWVNVSNMATIQAHGLNDRIDPPEGMIYSNGSRVIITGPDVSQYCWYEIIEFVPRVNSSTSIVYWSPIDSV